MVHSGASGQDVDPRSTHPPTAPASRAKRGKQKLKKDGTPYKSRKGWGPYRSVPNERSVAFNLQLDVQNLQQEVSNLLALRDILATKTLVQRQTPEGSLTRLVNEYLYVFRKGVAPQQPGGGRIVEERDQRAFMHSVMDPDVELGPGLPRGPDVIMDQMATYCNFLRFISLTGVVDSIVVAEDSVLVSDAASFVFQVTRSTIELIFPHIIGSEWLVAQLVGREVEAQGRSTFHFNAAGKCFRYDVEMNFVGAFMNVVSSPGILDILFGRALITKNGMIGIADEPHKVEDEDEEEEKAAAPPQESAALGTSCCDTRVDLRAGRCSVRSKAEEFCQKVVDDYFSVFANGYLDGDEDAPTPIEVSQQNFFVHRFGSQKETGANTTVSGLTKRWRALGECFEFLGFQQSGSTRMDCDNTTSMCQVASEAKYVLRITPYTIESVFPHLLLDESLVDVLVGKVIMVPSHVTFYIEKSTGYILRINERMDFSVAIAEVLPDQRDLSFVISQALLKEDGPDPSQHWRKSESRPSSRTMDIADILC
ncbi:WD repeat-containing protein 60 [Phytophthora pseudosyringae]|uniref:WD repeat-containing protein 60 n=1 Tax=Phytophthora pseudosyringae TaxID=221518 RepID=A0A8T1W0Z6_9STRA|nr:WD repeat-containing protein 60 [Phytophthora pseudosyringae]